MKLGFGIFMLKSDCLSVLYIYLDVPNYLGVPNYLDVSN